MVLNLVIVARFDVSPVVLVEVGQSVVYVYVSWPFLKQIQIMLELVPYLLDFLIRILSCEIGCKAQLNHFINISI
jgi:hypothetical protein